MTSARDWIRSRCPEALAAFEQAGAQTLADYAAGFGADAALPRPLTTLWNWPPRPAPGCIRLIWGRPCAVNWRAISMHLRPTITVWISTRNSSRAICCSP